MPKYRYRFTATMTDIGNQVPGILVEEPLVPSIFKDIDANEASKADLDDYMVNRGYSFESTNTPVSPAQEFASEGLSPSTLIFRPGVASDTNHVETWEEVDDAVAFFDGHFNVIIDDSVAPAIVPATANTHGFGKLTLSAYNPVQGAYLTIEDGGRIRNLGGLYNIILLGAPTSTRPLYFGGLSSFQGFLLNGAVIGNSTGATVAMIEVDCDLLALCSELISALNNDAQPLIPIITINPNKFLGWNVQQHADAVMPATLIEGDATTTLNIDNDASIVAVTQTNFLGSYLNNRLSKAEALQPSAHLSKDIAAGGTFVLASGESSKRFLVLTGTLLGDATIEFPASDGAEWIVKNSATLGGAFSVTLKVTGSASQFDLPNGTQHVWTDGTDLMKVAPLVT